MPTAVTSIRASPCVALLPASKNGLLPVVVCLLDLESVWSCFVGQILLHEIAATTRHMETYMDSPSATPPIPSCLIPKAKESEADTNNRTRIGSLKVSNTILHTFGDGV